MSPRLAIEDYANLARVDPEHISYFSLVKSISFKLKNSINIVFLKLGAGVLRTFGRCNLYAKDIDCVALVLRWSDQLKIGKAVVRLNAIDMVDLHSLRNRAIEALPDQAMHKNHLHGLSFSEADTVIAVMTDHRLTNKPGPTASAGGAPAHNSTGRNLVSLFIPKRRYPNISH